MMIVPNAGTAGFGPTAAPWMDIAGELTLSKRPAGNVGFAVG